MTTIYTEPCTRCRSTGKRWLMIDGKRTPIKCNTCKGRGVRIFLQPADVRANTRAKTRDRNAKKLLERITAYQAEHPAIWEWMHTADATFAGKMRDSLMKWGGLTDAQHAVALRASAGTYRKARLL